MAPTLSRAETVRSLRVALDDEDTYAVAYNAHYRQVLESALAHLEADAPRIGRPPVIPINAVRAIRAATGSAREIRAQLRLDFPAVEVSETHIRRIRLGQRRAKARQAHDEEAQDQAVSSI